MPSGGLEWMILLEGSGMRGNLKPKTFYISKTSFLLQANVRVASMDFLVILQNNYQNIVLKMVFKYCYRVF